MNRAALGRAGERRAWRYLKKRGMRLITRNWRCKAGELDLIARQDNTLVIIEVRSSASKEPFAGGPEYSVGPDKQRRLKRLARLWLAQSEWQPEGIRFDVIAVRKRGWLLWDIRHYPHAFDEC